MEVFYDPLLATIAHYCVAQRKVMVSTLQRRYAIGYNRATNIINRLQELGIESDKSTELYYEAIVNAGELTKILTKIGMRQDSSVESPIDFRLRKKLELDSK